MLASAITPSGSLYCCEDFDHLALSQEAASCTKKAGQSLRMQTNKDLTVSSRNASTSIQTQNHVDLIKGWGGRFRPGINWARQRGEEMDEGDYKPNTQTKEQHKIDKNQTSVKTGPGLCRDRSSVLDQK